MLHLTAKLVLNCFPRFFLDLGAGSMSFLVVCRCFTCPLSVVSFLCVFCFHDFCFSCHRRLFNPTVQPKKQTKTNKQKRKVWRHRVRGRTLSAAATAAALTPARSGATAWPTAPTLPTNQTALFVRRLFYLLLSKLDAPFSRLGFCLNYFSLCIRVWLLCWRCFG